LHGVVPADPEVRASATRLGRVFLRNKSADQLKRQELWTWLVFGIVIVAGVAAAVVNLAGDRFYYLVIAVLAAIVLPFSLLTLRRIQRHVALLAAGPA
jgi:Flp pilus assembly protein TadB